MGSSLTIGFFHLASSFAPSASASTCPHPPLPDSRGDVPRHIARLAKAVAPLDRSERDRDTRRDGRSQPAQHLRLVDFG